MCGCENKTELADSKQKTSFIQEFQRGPLNITIKVSPEKPTIADRILLEIVVDVSSDYHVVMPDFGEQIGQVFFIYSYYNTPVKIENKRKIYQSSYEIEALVSGSTTIPPITFRYQKGEVTEESSYKAQTDAITMDIESFDLATEEVNDIYDIQPNIDLRYSLKNYIIISLLAFVFMCVMVLYRVFYRSPIKNLNVVDMRTPEEIAWEKLNELINKDYIAEKKYQAFYFELTMIVRLYTEKKYHLNAPGQTTEEFLQNIASTNIFNKEQQINFSRFLEATDFVKYAAQDPEAKEVEMIFETAKIFMNLQNS